MRARQRNLYVKRSVRRVDCRCTAQQSTAHDGVCVNIVFGRKSKVNRLFAVYFLNCHELVIVSVDTDRPFRIHKVKNLGFCLQNTVPASEKFQMALTDICHHANIRLYHLA